jgi:hypothetical protein
MVERMIRRVWRWAAFAGLGAFCGIAVAAVDADQATASDPPIASIVSPASGQTYRQFELVRTAFSCFEGAGGPGLEQCNDSSGAVGSADSGSGSFGSGTLDTSIPGVQTYYVGAVSNDGLSTQASISYTVLEVPSVSIAVPEDGAHYVRGQLVRAFYECPVGEGGPFLADCEGTVPPGQAIDTSTLGPHTFSATAVDRDGISTTKTARYTVVYPDNRFELAGISSAPDGALRIEVDLPGPGTMRIRATTRRASTEHGHRAARRGEPFVFARRDAKAGSARVLDLGVKPTARGERLLQHQRRRIFLKIACTYTPTYGLSRTITRDRIAVP